MFYKLIIPDCLYFIQHFYYFLSFIPESTVVINGLTFAVKLILANFRIICFLVIFSVYSQPCLRYVAELNILNLILKEYTYPTPHRHHLRCLRLYLYEILSFWSSRWSHDFIKIYTRSWTNRFFNISTQVINVSAGQLIRVYSFQISSKQMHVLFWFHCSIRIARHV